MRCANVYDISPKTYVIKLSRPGEKALLLIESGVRVHLTRYARESGAAPSGMAMKLRKHLRSKRLERVRQIGTDRVLVLSFGSPPVENHLIIELYDRGNLVLTDSEHQVLTLLRNSKHDSDTYVSVRDTYPLGASKQRPPLSPEWLRDTLMAADANAPLRTVLMRAVPVGKELVEHCLLFSKMDGSCRMSAKPWEDGGAMGLLLQAISEAFRYFDADAPPPTGIIVLKQRDDAEDGKGGGGGGGGGGDREGKKAGGVAVGAAAAIAPHAAYSESEAQEFDEFSPYELLQHAGARVCRFPAFWEAVDEHFAQVERARGVSELQQQQHAAWKKVDKIRHAQDERISSLRTKEEEDRLRGEMLQFKMGEVDALLSLIRTGVDSGMDWEELAELVDASAAQGDALAAMVHKLDLGKSEVTIALEVDDENDEALEAPSLLLTLDLRLSAAANARAFYVAKKAAAAKTAKTVEAAEAAVRAAEAKAQANVAKMKLSASIRAIRRPFWFDKFAWFVSSENLLVLAANDAHSADLLVTRHMDDDDVYVMADTAAASPCVIKRRLGGAVPPLTLQQAGAFVLCRSNAWTSREVTSAWWVSAKQVLLEPPPGARLDPGCFLMEGTKNYLPPAQLIMGMAVMFKVRPSCVSRHLRERRVRAELRAGGEDGQGGDDGRNEDGGGDGGDSADGDGHVDGVVDGDGDGDGDVGGGDGSDDVDSSGRVDGDGGGAAQAEDEPDSDDDIGPVMRFTANGVLRVVLPPTAAAAGGGSGGDSGGGGGGGAAVGEDGEEGADSGAGDDGADASGRPIDKEDGGSQRLSAKQKRQARKLRAGAQQAGAHGAGGHDAAGRDAGGGGGRSAGGVDADSVAEGVGNGAEQDGGDGGDGGDSDEGDGGVCGVSVCRVTSDVTSNASSARQSASAASAASVAASLSTAVAPANVRGKKGKLKKLKEKYADQDEEERQTVLSLLGSAGKSKQQSAKEAREAEAALKAQKQEAKEQRLRERQQQQQRRHEEEQRQRQQKRQQQQQQREEARQGAARAAENALGEGRVGDADADADADSGDEEADLVDTDVRELLEEPSIQALDPAVRAQLAAHDTLTGTPLDDEEIMYAVAVCAPYSALSSYKFRVKLTPGSQKKGKAARQAIGIFCASASPKERDLCVALKDDELVRNMLGNVKVVASGMAQASRAAKNERKAAATTKRQNKQKGSE